MTSITLDAGLNLLWLAISVFALILFRHCDWKRRLAVFIATVALFPIVSDSDDLLSFSLIGRTAAHHRNAGTTSEDSREKDSIQLARLLEALDHYRPVSVYEFSPALYCAPVSPDVCSVAAPRFVLTTPGRAPPSA